MEINNVKVEYANNHDVNISELDELIESIGWEKRGNSKWKEVISKTSCMVIATKKDRIVGMGRIVDDGVMCMFYDILVESNSQGEGIGKDVIMKLKEYTEGKNFQSMGLFAWDKNPILIPFYKKMGFTQVDFGMKLKNK